MRLQTQRQPINFSVSALFLDSKIDVDFNEPLWLHAKSFIPSRYQLGLRMSRMNRSTAGIVTLLEV